MQIQKHRKWAWPNSQTQWSGQLWAAQAVLAGKIERWPIWPGPAIRQKRTAGPVGGGPRLPGQAKKLIQ